MKVFLPILIKGIIQLYKEIVEANEDEYMKQLKEANKNV